MLPGELNKRTKQYTSCVRRPFFTDKKLLFQVLVVKGEKSKYNDRWTGVRINKVDFEVNAFRRRVLKEGSVYIKNASVQLSVSR